MQVEATSFGQYLARSGPADFEYGKPVGKVGEDKALGCEVRLNVCTQASSIVLLRHE